MREILSDLVAEQQFLDQFLQKIGQKDWERPTPAKGWSIRDTISHLADSAELAADALNGGSKVEAYRTAPNLDTLRQEAVKKGRKMRYQDVIEWWRGGRAKVVEPLSKMEAETRIEWIAGSMSARTFATMRLMENWAHGLDIYAAMKAEIEDTPRIRHVCFLGWKTLPYAFKAADMDYSPVRVEVMGPGYAKWVFGSADTDQVIKGPAGQFARLAVRRIKLKDAKNLKATGEIAQTALEVVRAYL
ncbi:MAG TPA: maleylpyruvate isomerase family mycothiol-dependent enzyme [Acidimicrobiia bacterium]|nr:maleylpyruvate isomerase family mycothiol-dependent enzyme [Acidimicrobiia bacterium]